MAKETESLINVVIREQAKAADKPEPKGAGVGIFLVNAGEYTDSRTPGEKAEPNLPVLITWNVVNLYIPVHDGKPTARKADGCAGKDGGESKSLAVMAGIRIAISSCPKGSRLPPGLSLQESLENFF